MKKKRGRKPKNQKHSDASLDESNEQTAIKKIAEKVKKEKIHYVNSGEFEAAIRGFYISGKLTAYLGESVSNHKDTQLQT